ncbi:MAG TPA: AraC family ligand binding domain-containing protein, partial [Sphingopyxis sp.]|nr:AraC family ligand binding domain-containing protein [Sphingopyxis sp.]
MKHSVDVLVNDRPVIALQDEYPAGFIDPMHSHDHIQILYASAGVMSVRTPETSFVIPPQRAVWLPAGTRHEVACRGPVSLRTLYLPCAGHEHERECRVFEVSNLVKSLILEVVDFPALYDVNGREGRIITLLLDEIGR